CTPWVLIIEAKIDAAEGEEQLAKYEDWLARHAPGRHQLLVFLTPTGYRGESSTGEWQTLTYLDLVRIFREVLGELKDKHGYHFLRYYLAGVLRDICRWPLPIQADAADPHAVASYVKSVRDPPPEGTADGHAR